MIKNYISIVFLAFISAMSITHLSAQERVEKYKVVVLEKSIDENGNEVEKKVVKEGDEAKAYIDELNKGKEHTWITKDGEEIDLNGKDVKMIAKRAYKIITKDEDGNEKTIEWDGEGEMPAEIKEALEKEGIADDIENMVNEQTTTVKAEGVQDIQVDVEVDASGEKKRKVKVISMKDGEKEVMEFVTEGDELPEEVKKMLDKEGITLEMNVKEEETKDIEMKVEVDASGKKVQKIKIISDENGKREVIDLEVEGDEIPEDVQKILDEHNIDLTLEDGDGGQKVVKVIKEEKATKRSNKPQLGVLIENADKGVLITDVMPESSADKGGLKKGDVVTAVNGSETALIKDLQKAIADQGVGDVIEVDYIRDGKKEKSKVTLQKRISQFEFETWDEVMNSGKIKKGKTKEISIEKEVIIKKN